MANYGAPYGGGAGQPYRDPRFHDPRAQQPSSYFPQTASPQPGYQQTASPQPPQYAGQHAVQSDNQQHDAMNGLVGQMGGLDVSGVPAR